MNALPLLRQGITWRINEGNAVRIGIDPWVGCGNAHRLLADLVRYLNNRGIIYIKHIGDWNNSTFLQQAWKSSLELDIPKLWRLEWQHYIEALAQAHIRLTEELDEVIWAFAKNVLYSPKEGYIKLMDPLKPQFIDPN